MHNIPHNISQLEPVTKKVDLSFGKKEILKDTLSTIKLVSKAGHRISCVFCICLPILTRVSIKVFYQGSTAAYETLTAVCRACEQALVFGFHLTAPFYVPFTVPFYARSCHSWKSFTETIDLNCIARDYLMTDKPIHTLGIVAYPEDFRPSNSSVILLAKAWR